MLRFHPGSVSTPELLMDPRPGWRLAGWWDLDGDEQRDEWGRRRWRWRFLKQTHKNYFFQKHSNLWTEIRIIFTTGKSFKSHNMSLVDGRPTLISELNRSTYILPTSNWLHFPIARKIWGHSVANQLLLMLKKIRLSENIWKKQQLKAGTWCYGNCKL